MHRQFSFGRVFAIAAELANIDPIEVHEVIAGLTGVRRRSVPLQVLELRKRRCTELAPAEVSIVYRSLIAKNQVEVVGPLGLLLECQSTVVSIGQGPEEQVKLVFPVDERPEAFVHIGMGVNHCVSNILRKHHVKIFGQFWYFLPVFLDAT